MTERVPVQSDTFFVSRAETTEEAVGYVEGVPEEGSLTIRPLIVGERAMVFEARRKKGLHDPPHRHDDHESIAYLVSGRMKLIIGGKEFIAEAGSAWIHPIGVEHSSVALEDCVQITVKSPPRKTWQPADE